LAVDPEINPIPGLVKDSPEQNRLGDVIRVSELKLNETFLVSMFAISQTADSFGPRQIRSQPNAKQIASNKFVLPGENNKTSNDFDPKVGLIKIYFFQYWKYSDKIKHVINFVYKIQFLSKMRSKVLTPYDYMEKLNSVRPENISKTKLTTGTIKLLKMVNRENKSFYLHCDIVQIFVDTLVAWYTSRVHGKRPEKMFSNNLRK
jgi:hypothetical protein